MASTDLRNRLKHILARWLTLAERDFRLAQETHDGSPRARRRYRWAHEQLRLAEWEATMLLGMLDSSASATRPEAIGCLSDP